MMLEFWKDATDKRKVFGALLTELSKAFDCLCHDLLTAEFYAYDLHISCLNLLQDYLSNCKQRSKVDSIFISWKDILSRVPQGSVWVHFRPIYLYLVYS